MPNMPKNVIVVLLDSLNRHMLGSYGGTEFDTPNIDRFARRAVQFDKTVCTAHVGECHRAEAGASRVAAYVAGRRESQSEAVGRKHPQMDEGSDIAGRHDRILAKRAASLRRSP